RSPPAPHLLEQSNRLFTRSKSRPFGHGLAETRYLGQVARLVRSPRRKHLVQVAASSRRRLVGRDLAVASGQVTVESARSWCTPPVSTSVLRSPACPLRRSMRLRCGYAYGTGHGEPASRRCSRSAAGSRVGWRAECVSLRNGSGAGPACPRT